MLGESGRKVAHFSICGKCYGYLGIELVHSLHKLGLWYVYLCSMAAVKLPEGKLVQEEGVTSQVRHTLEVCTFDSWSPSSRAGLIAPMPNTRKQDEGSGILQCSHTRFRPLKS